MVNVKLFLSLFSDGEFWYRYLFIGSNLVAIRVNRNVWNRITVKRDIVERQDCMPHLMSLVSRLGFEPTFHSNMVIPLDMRMVFRSFESKSVKLLPSEGFEPATSPVFLTTLGHHNHVEN